MTGSKSIWPTSWRIGNISLKKDRGPIPLKTLIMSLLWCTLAKMTRLPSLKGNHIWSATVICPGLVRLPLVMNWAYPSETKSSWLACTSATWRRRLACGPRMNLAGIQPPTKETKLTVAIPWLATASLTPAVFTMEAGKCANGITAPTFLKIMSARKWRISALPPMCRNSVTKHVAAYSAAPVMALLKDPQSKESKR